ncbi:High-affinity branched-chain amino acid transport system permease protein LivH [Anaerolineales bacterium]|nr:High-affinity branched-chain amino acid transport system permease protein LivH [Anaerolineales bacterium]
MLESLAQNLVFGILLGALYGLAAVGIALVFGVTKFLNVAHGELLMLGGYACFWLFSLLDLDPFLSLPLTIIFLFLIGAVLYQVLFVRMVKLPVEEKIKNTMLIGFGLTLILQNVALLLWTADDRGITTSYSGAAFSWLGVRFPYVRVAGLVISLVCLFTLQQFLRKTYTGKAIRATVENWEAASLMGIDVYKVYLISFLLGTAVAGVAGALVSVSFSIEPSMGMHWTLKSLIVMVLGGVGNFMGTFVGGILLGVTESVTGFFISSNYRQVVGLVLFLLILIFRPQGLFGAKER